MKFLFVQQIRLPKELKKSNGDVTGRPSNHVTESQSLLSSVMSIDPTAVSVQQRQHGGEIHSAAQSDAPDQMTLVGVRHGETTSEKMSRLFPSVGHDHRCGREQMMRFISGGAEVKPLGWAAQEKTKGGTTIWA